MKLIPRYSWLAGFVVTLGGLTACSSDNGSSGNSATGGAQATGGSTSKGGANGSGGSSATNRGGATVTSGGAPKSTGGEATSQAGRTSQAGSSSIAAAGTPLTGNAGAGTAGAATAGAAGAAGAAAAGTGGCGTAEGTFEANTTFTTSGVTAPYQSTLWSSAIGDNATALVQTIVSPAELDCSGGCARFSTKWVAGTSSDVGGNIVYYFGGAENLLNSTITIKLAAAITKAEGATDDPPVRIELYLYRGLSGAKTEFWMTGIGSLPELDAASGFHTYTTKVTDVPAFDPTSTLCASDLHALGIALTATGPTTAANAGKLDLYFQSITIGR